MALHIVKKPPHDCSRALPFAFAVCLCTHIGPLSYLCFDILNAFEAPTTANSGQEPGPIHSCASHRPVTFADKQYIKFRSMVLRPQALHATVAYTCKLHASDWFASCSVSSKLLRCAPQASAVSWHALFQYHGCTPTASEVQLCRI